MATWDTFWSIYKLIRDRQIKWQDFRKVGVEEDYYDYYYAESELYVIHDRIFDSIEFVRAKSPREAIEKHHSVRKDVFCHGEDDE